MDDKGYIRELTDEQVAALRAKGEKVTLVPQEHEAAAMQALIDRASLLESQNLRAAKWAARQIEIMQQEKRNKKARRAANKRARRARKEHRQ